MSDQEALHLVPGEEDIEIIEYIFERGVRVSYRCRSK